MEDQNLTPSYPAEISQQERSLSMWMHLGPLLAGFLNFLIPIPFLTLIVILTLYYTQKDKSRFVDDHGRESLNFQITFALVVVTLIILMAVLFGSALLTIFLGSSLDSTNVTGGAMGIGISAMLLGILFFAIGIFALVVMIMGSVQANSGKTYRYPLSIRLVK